MGQEEQSSLAGRIEKDFLGEKMLPESAYYGVQTLRGAENFHITGVSMSTEPDFVKALGYVKKAAALANRELGVLDETIADAIVGACDKLIAGEMRDQFITDFIQGGAGTSTNMNANEVIANRALELAGRAKGEYDVIHPIDDVNRSQSTNDTYPTAVKLALTFSLVRLLKELALLSESFRAKGREFRHVLKVGRTQLQDAVPMTLGQEFHGFATTLDEDYQRLTEATALLTEINLGATAIGTGITADPGYAAAVCRHLREVTGLELSTAPDLIEATSDAGAFMSFSAALKRSAIKLSKICNDLRLLSSGPRTGIGEIRLPAVQAGSSIMPGKVNPVIPEVVNQVAFLVIGHDLTVTMCAEGGQLQLNAFEPTIGYCVLSSLRMLTAAVDTLTKRCVDGIEADRERCRSLVQGSIGLITALAPSLGYEASSRVARRALKENRSVADIVLEEKLLTEAQLNQLLELEAMTRPARRQPVPKS